MEDSTDAAQILRVTVKWGIKELDVEIDKTKTPCFFKFQLYALTGVPPESQKVLVGGGKSLQDDADWDKVRVKKGQKWMLIGTPVETVVAPKKCLLEGYSAGLYNCGNTCYMNSTIQCLHSVPELKSLLLEFLQSGQSNDLDETSHLLIVATSNLLNELDKNAKPVGPMQFWMVLRKKFSQFGARKDDSFMQQDAEECWTQLICSLSQSLRSRNAGDTFSAVKALFGVDLDSRVYCQESGEESTEMDSTFALKCHIPQSVNHLLEGLKHALKSELESNSPALGRRAIYFSESRISGLPRYLTIHFVRFFWDSESNQKAKILQKVDYPLKLDVYDLCSDELKKKLEGPRRGSSNGGEESSTGISQAGPSEKEAHLTGVYDLVAVLTHKGSSVDSGHYISWVKQENGKWVQYDDDKLSLQQEEDIVKLSGGGKLILGAHSRRKCCQTHRTHSRRKCSLKANQPIRNYHGIHHLVPHKQPSSK